MQHPLTKSGCVKRNDIAAFRSLIVEVPGDAEVDAQGIDGVVGRPEGVAIAGVEVGDVDVTAHALDGEVGVAVEDGVVAELHAGLRGVLHHELPDEGGVVGGVVAGEIAHIDADLHT